MRTKRTPAPRHLGAMLLLAVGVLSLLVPTAAATSSAAGPAASGSAAPLTGNITGPTDVPTQGNGTYHINATGGAAYQDGHLIGTINWTATVQAVNLTGVSISPKAGSLSPGSLGRTVLTVGRTVEVVTITVEVTSTFGKQTDTTNLTFTVHVRQPYILQAKLTAGATAIQSFKVLVSLDGVRVGNVSIPSLRPFQSYTVTFRYPTFGLSSGYHTFELSVANEHGLVTFSGGRTSISTTFYVAPGNANYSVWYVAGAVAFFGALFIFATRVAARRRGSGRR